MASHYATASWDRRMLKSILFSCFLTLACGSTGGAQGDPCAPVVEPSAASLFPGSKVGDIAAADPEYKAALTAMVTARTDVMKKETDMLASVGGGLLAQRIGAENDQRRALIDAGVSPDFILTRAELDGACLDAESIRLTRAATDVDLRRTETAKLDQLAKNLRAQASLAPEQMRQAYVAETERITAQASQPAKALSDLKRNLAQAKQLLEKLKAQ